MNIQTTTTRVIAILIIMIKGYMALIGNEYFYTKITLIDNGNILKIVLRTFAAFKQFSVIF